MVQTHSRTAHDYAQWVSMLVAHAGSYGLVSGLSQQVGVARQTLYRWKAKAGGTGSRFCPPRPKEPLRLAPWSERS